MLSKKKLVLVPNSTIMRMSFTYYLGMFYLFFFIIAMHKMGKICFTKKWQFKFPKKI